MHFAVKCKTKNIKRRLTDDEGNGGKRRNTNPTMTIDLMMITQTANLTFLKLTIFYKAMHWGTNNLNGD